MILEQVVQGRSIGEAEIGLIRTLLSKNPDWHRTRLSRELCTHWNWRKMIKIPREEILSVYDAGPEAVVGIYSAIQSVREQFSMLAHPASVV